MKSFLKIIVLKVVIYIMVLINVLNVSTLNLFFILNIQLSPNL